MDLADPVTVAVSKLMEAQTDEWTYEMFKPMFIITWLRMGRVPTRERAAAQLEYLLADLPDDVMAILKADGNV